MRKAIDALARFMAILGGIVLTALVILTCVSVIGRGLNTFGHSDLMAALAPGAAKALIATGVGPLLGDFELVEAGVAFAIFAFMPICQLRGAHATVDLFTGALPLSARRGLIAFWEFVLAAVMILIAWRLFLGFEGKLRNGETSFLLQFPVWRAYAASLFAAVVAALVSAWCAGARLATLFTGAPILPEAEGEAL